LQEQTSLIFVLLDVTITQAGASCLISATVVTDKMTNRPKGFGFVKFASEEEANNAREGMNGKARSSFFGGVVSLLCQCCVPAFLFPLGEQLRNACKLVTGTKRTGYICRHCKGQTGACCRYHSHSEGSSDACILGSATPAAPLSCCSS
jgi:RNA recognition motif-containing protein